MSRSRKLMIIGAAALALGAGSAALAQATDGPPDAGISPAQAERATGAAVRAMGGGEVVAVRRADGAGVAWQVEVVKREMFESWPSETKQVRRVGVELNSEFEKVRYTNTGTGG
jgi:hypothetical protein